MSGRHIIRYDSKLTAVCEGVRLAFQFAPIPFTNYEPNDAAALQNDWSKIGRDYSEAVKNYGTQRQKETAA